ncbi:hypothetical protein JCM10207_001368, partial [Rhodosporidiobolus poonsookiae]
MSAPNTLSVVSYNLHRSARVLTSLLNTLTTPKNKKTHLLLLQEPPLTLPPPPAGWSFLSPPSSIPSLPAGERPHPRCVALVAPGVVFAQTLVDSRDVVVVGLQAAEGASVRCIGVYNPCRGGSTPFNRTVRDILPALLASSPDARPLVVAGDFNLRHPSWDPLYLGDPLDEAEEARLTFEEAGLVHLRPPGEPTWWGPRGVGETLDLALGNLQAEERLVNACIDESLECGSDHRPIRITLDISPSTAPPPPPRRLHRKLNAEKALETYLEALEALPPPPALVTAAEVDLEADRLSAALSAAATTAPLARPRSTRFANAWWTPEVAAASGEARRLANRMYRLRKAGRPDEAVEAATRVVRNRLHALMRREKARAEREEVEGVTEATLWRVVKRKLGREGGEGADSDTSATPSASPAASPSPVEHLEWPELREEEVRSALFDARPFAAAGPDDVPNHVLQTLWDSLRHRLVPLLAASLRLGHLPRLWRDATGVVLRKPKKPDYSNPKAYRLICFERCVAKLLGAFPSVRVERLTRELEEAGLPRPACEWVRSFMSERTCQLRFEGVLGEGIEWQSGLPQGSPLSPILFLLYNCHLIRASRTESSVAYGWIDDVNLLAWGKTVSEAVAAAQAVVPALEGWSETHQSAFEPAKTFVTLFSPRSRRLPPEPHPPVVLGGVPLAYSPSLVMLGTTLDSRLTFREHVARCVAKASTAAAGVRLLAGAKAGLAPKFVRRLVEAVVTPRLLWMGEVWYNLRRKTVSKGLEGVQRSCCLAVTGAYRTTSLAALQVEANLPPLDLVLRRRCFALALRALSATPTHPLHARARLARIVRGKRTHPSPLHLAIHAFPTLLPPSLAVEPLVPHPVAPWSPPPHVSVVVAPSKEEAVEAHDRLVAALPADRVLATPVRSVTLCLDNQGVVTAPFSPAPTPGQYLRLALRARALGLTTAYHDLQLTVVYETPKVVFRCRICMKHDVPSDITRLTCTNLRSHLDTCEKCVKLKEEHNKLAAYGFGTGEALKGEVLQSAVIACAKECLPFTLFAKDSLKPLMSDATRKNAPSHQTLSRALLELFNLAKDAKKKLLKDVDGAIWLMHDEWTSPNRYAFMGVLCQFLRHKDNGEHEVCTATLAVLPFRGSHSAAAIAGKLKGVMNEFALEKKVIGIASDNASACIKAVNLLCKTHRLIKRGSLIRCFAHTTQHVNGKRELLKGFSLKPYTGGATFKAEEDDVEEDDACPEDEHTHTEEDKWIFDQPLDLAGLLDPNQAVARLWRGSTTHVAYPSPTHTLLAAFTAPAPSPLDSSANFTTSPFSHAAGTPRSATVNISDTNATSAGGKASGMARRSEAAASGVRATK